LSQQDRQRRQRTSILFTWLIGWSALLLGGTVAQAADPDAVATSERPRISIIIDDMGDLEQAGLRAIRLPGAMTYAFLPHTPYSHSLAETAHKMGKEVMLHLPMQAMTSNRLLGPGALTLHMTHDQFRATVENDLASIPYAVGINNHMGSLLTRHPGSMQWLMDDIKQHSGLFFIDSRTTRYTVAQRLASENHIPVRRRDVFLDDDQDPAAILHQFNRLIDKAVRQGSAIGIGHPHDATLTVLEAMLPQLKAAGIELVPVSRLVHETPVTRLARQPAASTPGPLVYNTAQVDGIKVTSQSVGAH
jgi:polysaccharide deacetylase 2 family uncharacterized protein YibQ